MVLTMLDLLNLLQSTMIHVVSHPTVSPYLAQTEDGLVCTIYGIPNRDPILLSAIFVYKTDKTVYYKLKSFEYIFLKIQI